MITNYKLHIYLNLLLFIKKKKGIERVKIHILLSIESYFFTSYRRCYIFRADIGSNIALYDTTSPTPCRTCCICIKRNLSNVRNETNRFVVIFLEQRGDDFFFFFQSFPRLFSSFRVRRAHAIRVIVCPRGRRHYHRNWMKFSCRLTKNFIRAPCVDRYVFFHRFKII